MSCHFTRDSLAQYITEHATDHLICTQQTNTHEWMKGSSPSVDLISIYRKNSAETSLHAFLDRGMLLIRGKNIIIIKKKTREMSIIHGKSGA